MPSLDPRRATIFGQYAESYERWRPAYPADAVDWLVPAGATQVVDVGAGTGKLTGLLVRHGLAVTAVEPDAGMLDVLRRLHPAVEAHIGRAESMPLPDSSVDRLDPDHHVDESTVEGEHEPAVPGLEGETVERATFPWTWEATPDEWRSYLTTHSGFAVMAPSERDSRLDASRDLVVAACQRLGRPTAPIRHEARCFRFRPRPADG